jgi:hypothetical protein
VQNSAEQKRVGRGFTVPVKNSLHASMINMSRYFPICTYEISPRSVLCQVYSTLRKGVFCVSTPCSGVLSVDSPSSAPTYTNLLVLSTSISTQPIFRHPEFGGITFLRYIVETPQSHRVKNHRRTSDEHPPLKAENVFM